MIGNDWGLVVLLVIVRRVDGFDGQLRWVNGD